MFPQRLDNLEILENENGHGKVTAVSLIVHAT